MGQRGSLAMRRGLVVTTVACLMRPVISVQCTVIVVRTFLARVAPALAKLGVA